MSPKRWCLARVEASNFRSLVEPVCVDFPETGLVLLDGDSGLGKSSLLMAAAAALGYCQLPGTELQSWLTPAPWRAAVTLRGPAGELRVERGPGGHFIISGSAAPNKPDGKADRDRVLREVLGAAPAVIRALTYQAQDEPGALYGDDDADRRALLRELLQEGLRPVIDAVPAARAKAEAAAERRITLSAESSALARQAAQVLVPVLDFQNPSDEEIKQARESAAVEAANAEEAEAAADREWERQKQLVAALRLSGAEALAGLSAKSLQENKLEQVTAMLGEQDRAAAERRRRDADDAARSLREAQSAHSRAVAEATALATQASGVCAACRQPWGSNVAAAAAALPVATVEVERLAREVAKAGVAASEAQAARDAPLPSAAFQDKLAPLRASAAQSFARRQEEYRKALEASQTPDPYRKPRGSPLPWAQHLAALLSCRAGAATATAARQQAEQHRAQLAAAAEEAERQASAQERAGQEWADTADFGSAFEAAFLDDLGQEIGSRATHICQRLPNGTQIFVALERVERAGKPRLAPVTRVSGRTVAKRQLSGGQQVSVQLALAIAATDAVRGRTGAAPNWLVLDEVLKFQCAKGREAALELLTEISADRLVVLVCHALELRDACPLRLEVVPRQVGSAVRWAPTS